jgi:hypothetical protein
MHRSASIAKSLATLGCWGFEGPAMGIATPPRDHIPRGGVVRLLELADEIEVWLREVDRE